MGGFSWVTLATNDSYSLGALVLAHSLKQAGTVHQLTVLVTPGVTGIMREKLGTVFNVVKEVNILDSRDEANLRLLKRPELGITFTKLHCWRLTQFEKCVFLDADTMVLANCDELFDREEFSAAPDVGWPDCFNSGVFVYRPSEETYNKLVQFAIEKGSFDGGDQGLLNLYFSDWAHKDISKHLPFIYNMCSTACYSYLPAFKQFGSNIKIIHFIGNTKPWLQYFDTETKNVHVVSDIQHLQQVVQQWWNIFCSCIHPMLSPEMPTSRAPTTVHYPSYPSFGHTSHYYSDPDNSFFDTVENKSDSRNVFDPWEEYENKFDNPERQEDHTDHVPHMQSHSVDTVVHESHHHTHDTDRLEHNVATDVFRHSSNNSNNYNSNNNNDCVPYNPSCNEETRFDSNISSDRHEFGFSNNHSQNHSHTQPSLQPSSPEINTSSTTIDPALECNQLARPHECEPTSSVTNESALHDHPNEVHDGSAGLAGAFARLTLGVARTPEQIMLEDQLRRQGWEVGNIDYMGRDSFDNIWSKICETLSAGPPGQSYVPPPLADPTPAVTTEPIVVKQAVTEPTQQPITKIAEQETVVEKEQSKPIATVAEPPKPVILPSPKPVATPTSQPAAPKPQPAVPTPQPLPPTPVVSAQQASVPATPKPIAQTTASVPQPVASISQSAAPVPKPTAPVPQPAAPVSQPAAPVPQPAALVSQPTTPKLQSVAPIPKPVAAVPQPAAPTPKPAAAVTPVSPPVAPVSQLTAIKPVAPQTVAPTPQPSSPPQPVSKTVSTPQPAPVPKPTTQPPKPVPQPEPPKQVTAPPAISAEKKPVTQPESPKPISKPTLVSEPPKPQTTPPQLTAKPTTAPSEPPKKQPEPFKPAPPPAGKLKKESASPQPTEAPKLSVNVSKPVAEEAAGQKVAPQSPPPKEGSQSKPETSSADGPTPPPRKAASAQTAAAGAKKPVKGKK